jgi:hypothetical protein
MRGFFRPRPRPRSGFVPAGSNSEMQFSMLNALTPGERQIEDDYENEDDLVAVTPCRGAIWL